MTPHITAAVTGDGTEEFDEPCATRRRPARVGIGLAPLADMPSILIADDCAPVASIMARHIRDAGYEVSVAHDGAEALRLLARKPVDCILLDLMMPTMTGMELLHRLRKEPGLSAIPVVLVSASVGASRSHVFAERDADICVGKPFTRRQILDAVHEALRTRDPVISPPAVSAA